MFLAFKIFQSQTKTYFDLDVMSSDRSYLTFVGEYNKLLMY